MSELFDPASDPVAPTPAQPDDQIKLVRLITGEDILCVMRDDIEKGTWQPMDHIILSTPLKLVMHRTQPLRPASPMAIGIMQWLPDELLECHEIVVKIGHIVTVMEPKAELKAYYKKTVDLVQSNLIIGDKTIRQDITTASIDAARDTHREANAATDMKTTLETVNHNRMHELMKRLNELDDYLMMQDGEDEGPITFH